MLFFFQAEDGIRDGRVTGVQTCALPILNSGILPFYYLIKDKIPEFTWEIKRENEKNNQIQLFAPRVRNKRPSLLRSEERRVGKECRCRWSKEYERKKTKVKK